MNIEGGHTFSTLLRKFESHVTCTMIVLKFSIMSKVEEDFVKVALLLDNLVTFCQITEVAGISGRDIKQ